MRYNARLTWQQSQLGDEWWLNWKVTRGVCLQQDTQKPWYPVLSVFYLVPLLKGGVQHSMHNLMFSWSTFLSYCRTLTTVLDASWSWKKAISHNWTLQILTLVQTLASMSAAPQTSLGLKNRRLFCGCVVTWPRSGLSSVCWQKSWSWWSSSWFTRNARGQTRCQTVGYAKFLFFTQNYSSMSYMTHL